MKGDKSCIVKNTKLITIINLNLDELRKIVKQNENNSDVLYHQIIIFKDDNRISMCIP